MKRTVVIFFLILNSLFYLYSQTPQTDSYQFFVNLNNVNGKSIYVELITPKISADSIEYRFPAMVPGTYAVYNFGRFITNLKAFDVSGKQLLLKNVDINTWMIYDAAKLYRITYDVSDTYHSQYDNPVFEPAGMNIQPDTNYVINNHGFFGYFNSYIDNTYILKFIKPQGFYGATSLQLTSSNDSEDVFTSPGYHYLVDNPIMFCRPDTTSINFDEAKVMISVFSPGKGMDSKDIAENLDKVLHAIRNYLGGKLPVDRYTFIFYFESYKGSSGSNGALEHSQSSLYYMPDIPYQAVKYMLKELTSDCAHEFLHIVTPLNLHSEEIGNFDFNHPVMSEHLWLYEGVTEYTARYVQLKEGLITLKDYVKIINRELKGASAFNDTLPFTELSKGALDTYKSQYVNVYQKGALIGLCLDILIRDESNGTQSLNDVIQKLLEKYGKNKSFKDDELFGDITDLTSPKVGEFFLKYVGGKEHLPYAEIFGKAGLNVKSTPYQTIDFGHASMGFDQSTFRLKIQSIDTTNDFVKSLGVKKDDELISINGELVNFLNILDVFGSVNNNINVGDDFNVEVARNDSSGKEITLKLHAKIKKTLSLNEIIVSINDSPTERQLKVRNAWLGK